MSEQAWTEDERTIAMGLHLEQCTTHLASTGCRTRHLIDARHALSWADYDPADDEEPAA